MLDGEMLMKKRDPHAVAKIRVRGRAADGPACIQISRGYATARRKVSPATHRVLNRAGSSSERLSGLPQPAAQRLPPRAG